MHSLALEGAMGSNRCNTLLQTRLDTEPHNGAFVNALEDVDEVGISSDQLLELLHADDTQGTRRFRLHCRISLLLQ